MGLKSTTCNPIIILWLSFIGLACLLSLLQTKTYAAELKVLPDKLELTGRDPIHRVVVSLIDDQGNVTDATRRVSFEIDQTDTAAVDEHGTVTARSDGIATLTVRLDTLSATVSVRVAALADKQTPSFKQDVLPILTRCGCNTGGCHGKQAGQNGFRLSLRGYAPEWDYDWITQEVSGRRVDLGFPEFSLLLAKASGGIPHEGGVRFRPDSRMWQTLRDWIAVRAPAPVADEPDVLRLEVFPGDQVLVPGQRQQLLVRAHYADGRIRDVTWLAQFFSNDDTTVTVKPSGIVQALRSGAAGVRVHFQGLVSVVGFTMPFPHDIGPEVYTAQQNAIDGPLFQKLRQLRLPPAGPCTDETFLRRVYLDAAGILPTPAEVIAFEADLRADKRARAIDDLLQRSEFTDYWTLQLADLLQNRKERDHDVRGQKGVKAFHRWLREQVAANRPWSDIARDVLLAKGDVVAQPQAGYFVTVLGEFNKVEESELPDSVAQSFLGTRIGCARCHNHPLERYTQDDFYHFAACFAKVNLERQNPQTGISAVTTVGREERDQYRRIAEAATKLAEACRSELKDDEKTKHIADQQRELDNQTKRLEELRRRSPGVNQPRTAKFMAPQTLDRVALKVEQGSDPRIPFVTWAINQENFSGAMVNRLWKHFFAVGLVEPVDDLRASNPPTNAELWQVLNDEFRSHNFDLRYIIRLILNSRAWQLDSATTPENENDIRYYSHYNAKRLPAEVLLDAIAAATDVPNLFPGYPVGLRATQIADPGTDSYFLTLFGRSDRVTACSCERKGEVTLPQLLHLNNDEGLVKKIRSLDSRLTRLLQNPDSKSVTQEVFLATLSRLASEAERTAIDAALATDERELVFADLFWALLNSKEFAFNH
ncbi:MAG: DUF1549 and DUF1553 domain-containing protein [Planctomycetota bacterium]|nr:DUF1549 and DUF1553 domain-containing protein [Planctomycetota bacterium]